MGFLAKPGALFSGLQPAGVFVEALCRFIVLHALALFENERALGFAVPLLQPSAVLAILLPEVVFDGFCLVASLLSSFEAEEVVFLGGGNAASASFRGAITPAMKLQRIANKTNNN